MSLNRVMVTGLGAVSCFGKGVSTLWNGLVAGASGRAPIRSFDASGYRSSAAAEVPWGAVMQGEGGTDSSDYPLDGALRLATAAVAEALTDAGLSADRLESAGCVVGSLFSSTRWLERYAAVFTSGSDAGDMVFPDWESCLTAYQLEQLVKRFHLRGPSTLVSTACSSSTDAIGYAADFIRNGESDVMLTGGADVLARIAHAGFNAMFSITPDDAKPFDRSRNGFFIGEGAGMLVLEGLEHALARGAPIYAELLGYGLANAAFHLTAPSEDGSGEALAIKRCLRDAGVAPQLVDYVNAHGTATSHNDAAEAKAIRSVFGDRASNVAISSIKPNIGHCMGAAGALEAIATIKCIEQGFIPPTLNSSGDLDEGLGVVVKEGITCRIRYAMSQSLGFGGSCSAVLFGVVDELAQAEAGGT